MSHNTYLPTTMSSTVLALFRSLRHMSMVKRVLALLKMESRSLIKAAIITAIISPLAPGDVSCYVITEITFSYLMT